jgi:large subunit ribosomal protein L19
MDIIRNIERKQMGDRQISYTPGDTVAVYFKIREGDKERVQQFQGVVIQTRGTGSTATVTVRKSSGNVYVERIFPVYSPLISEVKVLKRGRVRRARIFYLRGRTGKSTRIKEQKKRV